MREREREERKREKREKGKRERREREKEKEERGRVRESVTCTRHTVHYNFSGALTSKILHNFTNSKFESFNKFNSSFDSHQH